MKKIEEMSEWIKKENGPDKKATQGIAILDSLKQEVTNLSREKSQLQEKLSATESKVAELKKNMAINDQNIQNLCYQLEGLRVEKEALKDSLIQIKRAQRNTAATPRQQKQ